MSGVHPDQSNAAVCFLFWYSAKIDVNRVHDLEMEFLAAIVSITLSLCVHPMSTLYDLLFKPAAQSPVFSYDTKLSSELLKNLALEQRRSTKGICSLLL